MQLHRESDGEVILPGGELGAGGQARVCLVEGAEGWVAKLYHQPSETQARKLRVMLAHPAADPGGEGGRPTLIWPADLLHVPDGRFAGFLMPRAEGMQRVFQLYNPASRRGSSPLFHYGLLHRAARNLAAVFATLHAAGYVIGDVNESNVLVSGDGWVTLIDTDSFQVRDPRTGMVYRCPVGRPEFTPPELQGRSLTGLDRSPEHDRFGLAVLIFKMLMEGTHPFAGRHLEERGDPPPIQQRISEGRFPYAPAGRELHLAPRTAPPFANLAPPLEELMIRCFAAAHRRPRERPEAESWLRALEAAEAALVTCARNDQHYYGEHLEACPWCERRRHLRGRDPFPSHMAVAEGKHQRPLRPARPARRRVPAARARPAAPPRQRTAQPRPRAAARARGGAGSPAPRTLRAGNVISTIIVLVCVSPLWLVAFAAFYDLFGPLPTGIIVLGIPAFYGWWALRRRA